MSRALHAQGARHFDLPPMRSVKRRRSALQQTVNVYTPYMRFEWDEAKRKSNLKVHGLDFAEAEIVFDGLTARMKTTGFATMNNAS